MWGLQGEELRSQEHCGLTPSLLSAEDRGLSCLRPPAICDTELHRMPTWLHLPDANKESHPPGSDTQRGSDQFCWKPRSLVAAKDACTILLYPSVSFSSYVTGHVWRVKLQTQSQRPGARARMCECVCARCIAAGGGAGRHASGGAGESLACIPLGRKESSESAVPALSSFLRPSSLPSLWLKALRVLPKSVPREMPSWPRDSVTRFSSELRS